MAVLFQEDFLKAIRYLLLQADTSARKSPTKKIPFLPSVLYCSNLSTLGKVIKRKNLEQPLLEWNFAWYCFHWIKLQRFSCSVIEFQSECHAFTQPLRKGIQDKRNNVESWELQPDLVEKDSTN